MKTLSSNWFFEDLLDLEYKKYVLLAYLQDVDKHFTQIKLYPQLNELVNHYRLLKRFMDQKNNLYLDFPERIDALDLANFKVLYKKVVTDDEVMEVISEIIGFALPKIKQQLDVGKEIYEFIESEIEFYPVGILPLYQQEGYLLLKDGMKPQIDVYEYSVKLFENKFDTYKAVYTTFVETFQYGISNTLENIKINLIKHRTKLPNPATFVAETKHTYPVKETLLHVIKHLLAKNIK